MRLEKCLQMVSITSVLLLVGCSKPVAKSGVPSNSGIPTVSSTGSPTGNTISLGDLFADLKAGPEFMDQKYGDKEVNIEGTLQGPAMIFGSFASEMDPDQRVDSLMLRGTFEDTGIGVKCEMAKSEPWQTVLPGQTIKIRGTGLSRFFPLELGTTNTYLILMKCEIVDAKPAQVPVLSVQAEQLVDEFLADPDACATKYDGKPLLVTGKLDVIDAESLFAHLSIESKGDVKLDCSFGMDRSTDYWSRIQSRSKGDIIGFLAESVGVSPADKKIDFYQCWERK